ncbi:carboxymuconolactone decarboxylase family protein [Actinobacteria bacterium YIM 96077]|uniref:Carboxymuconolactone decarboxylase family protein n=1 Tax=Phytoactinopolyspora halophila TaxID=1981511 RepID=A0A329R243_9ACTN|nr:carboxymuconolactone decarboxylase family protein [Phytoactinopolyspora halophila]AYY12154.1 carboxymuconolactone decarboxylase family protein [Actinobacteria bacterium YIM 96077]RAW18611.1 carboxymuconolactone decarboxylase family protein [Phytoactinopolyspora halophila]
MTQRIDMATAAPDGYRAVYAVEQYVQANVDHQLLELVKLRASMINECSFCVDMHSQDALKAGEDSRRLFAVAAWQEAPFFSEEERAALALTDAITRLGNDGVPDDVWDRAAAVWSEQQLAALVIAIGTINLWNRIAIPTRKALPE